MFSAAGEGVQPSSIPWSWRQPGVVEYLRGRRALCGEDKIRGHDPLQPGDVQASRPDARHAANGAESELENLALFRSGIPFLDSIFEGDRAARARQASVNTRGRPRSRRSACVTYRSSRPRAHAAHARARSQVPNGRGNGEADLGVDVAELGLFFHWQRMYFYEQPIPLTQRDAIRVTCELRHVESERTRVHRLGHTERDVPGHPVHHRARSPRFEKAAERPSLYQVMNAASRSRLSRRSTCRLCSRGTRSRHPCAAGRSRRCRPR